MKFVIFVAFLALLTLVLGQDDMNEELVCDDKFIAAYHNGTANCFNMAKEPAAEALLGQVAPAVIKAIFRKKRSDDETGLKKEWLNDRKKLAQMSEEIICMEGAVAHTEFYEKMEKSCEKQLAAKELKPEAKRHEKVTCMGETMAKLCKGKLGHGDKEAAPQ